MAHSTSIATKWRPSVRSELGKSECTKLLRRTIRPSLWDLFQ